MTRDSFVTKATNPCEVDVWSLARGYWKSPNAGVILADFWPPEDRHAQNDFVYGAVHWVQNL